MTPCYCRVQEQRKNDCERPQDFGTRLSTTLGLAMGIGADEARGSKEVHRSWFLYSPRWQSHQFPALIGVRYGSLRLEQTAMAGVAGWTRDRCQRVRVRGCVGRRRRVPGWAKKKDPRRLSPDAMISWQERWARSPSYLRLGGLGRSLHADARFSSEIETALFVWKFHAYSGAELALDGRIQHGRTFAKQKIPGEPSRVCHVVCQRLVSFGCIP